MTTLAITPTGLVLAAEQPEQACAIPQATEPSHVFIRHQQERLGDARFERERLFNALAKLRAEVAHMERCLMAANALVDTERQTLNRLIDEDAAWRRRVGHG